MVQNECPFLRPSDTYGGQPLFNCRNAIQAKEGKADGYEDDDENYTDDGTFTYFFLLFNYLNFSFK